MHKSLLTSLAISFMALAIPPAIETQAAMPGGSTIYAGLWSTNAEIPIYGIYSLSPDSQELMLADPKGNQVGYPIRSAWIADGKLCGYYVRESYTVVEQMYYIEVNPAGDVTRFDSLPDDIGYMFAATYNPDDRFIYGYGLTADYSYALMKAPIDNPGDFRTVREFDWTADEECLSIAYDTENQNLYGINVKNKLVKINPTTGVQTVVASIPFSANSLVSGMCYSPKEDLFYWNPQLNSGSAIYTFNADGTDFVKVYDCANDEQYNFLICPDKAGTAASPAIPEIKTIDFPNGATTGSFEITMPSTTAEGESLTGMLRWAALLDGEQVQEGLANAGSDVTVSFSDLEEGNHVFTFKAFNGEAASENASHYMWVGIDTPQATSNVVLKHDRIIWQPVCAGVNGGWIDMDNLQYEVYLNGVLTYTLGASDSETVHQLASAELKRYTASIIAKAGGKASEATFSNEVALGTPLQPGFTLVPDREDVDRMTVIDVNNDGRTWSYSLYQECAKSSFGSEIPMDDWLILSPVAFEGETSYTLSIDVQTCNSSYTEEYMRVCIADCPEPEAMTTELIPTFQPVREIGTFTVDFTLPAEGTYYIGFHTASTPDQEGLLLSNIRLYPTSSGVDNIEASDTTAEYFTLQGIRVEKPSSQGIYIVRYPDGRSAKVFVR